jgi:hypothetical protein
MEILSSAADLEVPFPVLYAIRRRAKRYLWPNENENNSVSDVEIYTKALMV